MYHAAALLSKEAALVRSFAARLQQNLGFLEHGPHTAVGVRLRDGARPRHGPEAGGGAAAGAGHGEEERVAQCGFLHAVPSLQCSGDQLLRCEVSEDSLHRQHPGLALAQLDMDSRTVAPEHTELVAGLRGLHMAAGDILRVVAASAQLLFVLVKMPCHFL